MPKQSNGWAIAAAIAALILGAILSRVIEPGVRVESVMLAGDTPALKFLPVGPGPHPIALLAHGVTASKETLFRFSETLAAAGFVCFAVDFPGHGDSKLLFARREVVRTLPEVAAEIGPVDVFLGHSMGAGVGSLAVRDAHFSPRLFIAVGANPDLGEHGPPLLLMAGWLEEIVPPALLRERTDARLVVSPWCDHILEPYDPQLVNAAVKAACATVGRIAPAPPTRWLWRLVGLPLGLLGALGLGLCLPEVFPALAKVRGPLLAVLCLLALALTANTWIGAVPHLRRAHFHIAAMLIIWLAVAGAGWLGISRWSLPGLAVVAWIGCAIAGSHFIMMCMSIVAMLLGTGALVGWIASRRGSRRGGDIAMAIIVGYAIGQWLPRIF